MGATASVRLEFAGANSTRAGGSVRVTAGTGVDVAGCVEPGARCSFIHASNNKNTETANTIAANIRKLSMSDLRVAYGTGSEPPSCHGWHLDSRNSVNQLP